MDFNLWSAIVLIVAIVLLVDVWRSPAGTGSKVIWTIFGIIFSIITAIVWLVWGRKKAYGESGARA
jgi:hypothetical protein